MKKMKLLSIATLLWVPVVAAAPSSTKRGDDANSDGRSDYFWHSTTQQQTQNWYMNGDRVGLSALSGISNAYRSAGVGDFNGDGFADIVWYDQARTTLWLWLAQNDGTYQVVFLRSYPAGWEIAGLGDFDADGRADLFWHNKAAGLTQIWNMNGATWTYGMANSLPSEYDVGGVGDVNGDGRADVIWQDEGLTSVWLWQGRATSGFDVSYLRSYPSNWHIDAIGDSNGDGREDIFWHSSTVGQTQSWLMNGSSWTYGTVYGVGSQYQVSGSGDFNGDGLLDIVWRNNARTGLWQWQAMAGGGYTIIYHGPYPTGWELLNY